MAPSTEFTKAEILRLLDLLNAELERTGIQGEVYLVGGAVMCVALDARASTRDVDAWIKPARQVREAAARVGAKAGVPGNWLNDAVKGWLGSRGAFDPFLERSHLKVFVAQPAYLLAMKCIAMRLGEEFHDLDDVRYLLRHQDITKVDDALAIIGQYFDAASIPPKARFALEEILQG